MKNNSGTIWGKIRPQVAQANSLQRLSSVNVTWNWSCVFMSRTDGLGWKEGCEWYQPTTLKPRDDSTSQACV